MEFFRYVLERSGGSSLQSAQKLPAARPARVTREPCVRRDARVRGVRRGMIYEQCTQCGTMNYDYSRDAYRHIQQ